MLFLNQARSIGKRLITVSVLSNDTPKYLYHAVKREFIIPLQYQFRLALAGWSESPLGKCSSPRLTDWLIVSCLTPFSTVFQLYRGDQCTYPCFPGILRTIFFPSHWLLSHITIIETTDSGEKGMNTVATTIINPRKEYWPSRGSNQRPPVLKSATAPTELLGSTPVQGPSTSGFSLVYYNMIFNQFIITGIISLATMFHEDAFNSLLPR